MRRKFLAVTVAILFSGCATPFPEGIPTAAIRFTSNVPIIVRPVCSRDSFIKQAPVKVDSNFLKEVSPVKMYGTQSDKNNEVIERLIPAERALPFRVRWGHYAHPKLTSCEILFSFSPRPDEQYQLDYRLLSGSCTLKLHRLSEQNGLIQKTELTPKLFEANEEKLVCR